MADKHNNTRSIQIVTSTVVFLPGVGRRHGLRGGRQRNGWLGQRCGLDLH